MSALPRVAVVGGSVGGLTAALVLADLGCEVDVFERSTAELEARGAGIVLHPLTVRYFEEQRPLDVAKVVVRLPWLRFLDRNGTIQYEERTNYRFSSWTTIYRNLLAGFDPDRYHLGYEMVGLDQDADRAKVHFADGESVTAGYGGVCRRHLLAGPGDSPTPHSARVRPGMWPGVARSPESDLEPNTAARLADAITYQLTGEGHILLYAIPGPLGRAGTGPPPTELRLVSQLRRGSRAEGPPHRPDRVPARVLGSSWIDARRVRGLDQAIRCHALPPGVGRAGDQGQGSLRAGRIRRGGRAYGLRGVSA